MAKADKSTKVTNETKQTADTGKAAAPASAANSTITTGGANPDPAGGVAAGQPTKQELNEIAAKAKIAEKAAKKEAADKAKAEREAKVAEGKTAREAAAAVNKLVREQRAAAAAEAGKTYTGSMLALAEASSHYVKGKNGQLNSGDPVATVLSGVMPADMVKLGTGLFGEDNKYAALNIGQQSMNYRNRIRGAIKSGKTIVPAEGKTSLIPESAQGEGDAAKTVRILTLEGLTSIVNAGGFDTATTVAETKAAEKKAREDKAAADKAEKEAKAKAAAAAKIADNKALVAKLEGKKEPVPA